MVSSVRFRVSPLLLLPAHGDFHLAPVARVSHLILYAAPPRIRRTDDYPAGWPLEMFEESEHTRAMFEVMNGESQLLYSSDYPHQDFDLPTQVYDLPFLSDAGRRAILGGNALKLFGLPLPEAPVQTVMGTARVE